ncbi:hypothetical protein [Nitrosomonas sp.]|uniref:hypothetical protein n=1 Tax=Nitrosomonas sp. TaxID=42353 RepID=UPI001D4A9909|nr:hypothetical protein [Nitrosomonas sp.]MBX3616533.1 hypothetical protein [Nitrosomonas sp.]
MHTKKITMPLVWHKLLLFVSMIMLLPWSAHAASQAKNNHDNCSAIVRAEIVALEQAYLLNRFGAFNPAGLLYALKSDVVSTDKNDPTLRPGKVKLRESKRPRPLVLRVNEGECLEVKLHNMLMPTATEERTDGPEQYGGKVPAHIEDPDGIVYSDQASKTARELVKPTAISSDMPWTRSVSFHPNGLEYIPIEPEDCPLSSTEHEWVCGSAASNVGSNKGIVHPDTEDTLVQKLKLQGSQIYPGQSALYRFHAHREGTYFAYSTGAGVGGEGNGGQVGLGLFGAVNVQPKGARWYRSQVSYADLQAATGKSANKKHPYSEINYEYERDGIPVLNMRKEVHQKHNKRKKIYEIVHSDLNAIIVIPEIDAKGKPIEFPQCKEQVVGNSCGRSFREFSVIMHDEVKAVQAFAELEDQDSPLHYIKDGMGINYGVGGLGAMTVARNRNVGPAKDCPECRLEEFFLSSWANGDPALILRYDEHGKKPEGAMYPDDPSNVHHSYLGDPVKFRNIHAGPKETHVFHLHAHQWVQDASDPNSTYLDSQTISPGATFSYEIEFGGSGNRNYTPGDSIFHCHLYPHFAQGMWELWRVHDVFEDGLYKGSLDAKAGKHWLIRNLPDAEVENGTENPAIVPIPGTALAVMPTRDFPGYPFYIPGKEGHRPPQPPLDMDVKNGQIVNGGLPRHIVQLQNEHSPEVKTKTKKGVMDESVIEGALKKGGNAAQVIANRVYQLNPTSLVLAEEWDTLNIKRLQHAGEALEIKAMDFHAGKSTEHKVKRMHEHRDPHQRWRGEATAYVTERASTVKGQKKHHKEKHHKDDALFYVNGRDPAPGAPYGDPCPAHTPIRNYMAAFIQTELTVNRHGWFDPQARIIALEQDVKDIIDANNRDRLPEPLFFRANSGDCIVFHSSNFVPNALNVDDFQIYTPTDTIGQHIHLVKFDVTSSDGSGNGWNYEDGTFSPDEVRERVFAINKALREAGRPESEMLKLETHPLFEVANLCTTDKNDTAAFERCSNFKKKGECPQDWEKLGLAKLAEDHPYCGAQRTIQRWWADPIINEKTDKDNTLRTVFTHDHFGPSSHQQHGLYAALVVEPTNSVWLNLGESEVLWDKVKSKDKNELTKLIGGADFNKALPAERDPSKVKNRHKENKYNPLLGMRDPLELREDGGPTSTRANIIAPKCIGNPESNPLNPGPKTILDCPEDKLTHGTRREFTMAFADFAILYNTALEPINPEKRDQSALYFGRRQVPLNKPMPLAISSEDPGTQLINYRNEPIGLRIAERAADSILGGFNYEQKDCRKTQDDELSAEEIEKQRIHCTGDMANVFSTHVHANRDRIIAEEPYGAIISPATKALLTSAGKREQLEIVLENVELWRKQFNCALYPHGTLPGLNPEECRIANLEPWRELGDPATPILPVYEGDPVQIRLIQGAQEAQHVFTMNGVKWLRQPASFNSGYTNAQPLGISEHFEFNVNITPLNVPRLDYLYFGSSMDQLWDGMWGVMRSYGHIFNGDISVAKLNKFVEKPNKDNFVTDPATKVCDDDAKNFRFDISAVRACQLFENACTENEFGKKGIMLNQRLDISDPNAIVFVRSNLQSDDFFSSDEKDQLMTDRDVLEQLKEEFKNGRVLEPLILRASAGACINVQLRNHLPLVMHDGPFDAQDNPIDGHFGHNFMSMILDGFNYNQFRMSSSVGLSVPMLAQNPLISDGTNAGINGIESDKDPVHPNKPKKPNQGSLLPACSEKGSCRTIYTWYAGDYNLDQGGNPLLEPIEFGALPLRSFGDVIKHPAHGAIGALVIGPKDSRVCKAGSTREQEADRRSNSSASICNEAGELLYRDFVLVLQDAVDATMDMWPIGNLKGAEEPDDYGVKAINYRTEPIWGRRGEDPSIEFEERNEFDYSNVLSSKIVMDKNGNELCQAGIEKLFPYGIQNSCDPETPIFVTEAGRDVRFRIVHPGGHTRQQAITVHGHQWTPFPWEYNPQTKAMTMLTSGEVLKRHVNKEGYTAIGPIKRVIEGSHNAIGPMMAANLVFKAGGEREIPMDYLYRSQASFLFDGGIWGLLRVVPKTAQEHK